MAFKRLKDVTPLKSVEYNSNESKQFLEFYNSQVEQKIAKDSEYVPSKSFAPSSIRCKRHQWFRLRGTKPDAVTNPDVSLKFIADIGTHCHRRVQENLSEFLKDDWVDVEQYLIENPPQYKYSVKKDGYETRIKVEDPPVKFSCDGLIKINGVVYLLEIKTSEASSMRSLIAPKPEHLDQIKCYCALLGISDAMAMYIDRQYGDVKCFTYHMSKTDVMQIVNVFEDVQLMVERNMIPEALPYGDKWCSSSYCKYYRTCRKWGK